MKATPTPDADHQALLEAIGRALEQDGPYEELLGERDESLHLRTMEQPPASEKLRVLGGAVDAASGRVAWIEQLSHEPVDDYVPMSLDVVVAWGGLRRSVVPVPAFSPYCDCRVGLMRWYGEALLFIYREKDLTLAARMDPPYGAAELVKLRDECVADGDTVYFVSDRPGLIEARLLPSLAPALPLPVASASKHLMKIWQHAPGLLAAVKRPPAVLGEDWKVYEARLEAARAAARPIPLPSPEARALVGTPARLWARLHELLAETAPPRHGVDVLVGAVATPYWRDEAPHGTAYDKLHTSGHHPGYLPVYWYRHLVELRHAQQDEAWLRWLDQVAALPSVELEPWTRGVVGEELVARTALAHLRLRAASLAEICRTGQLPELEWCYFFGTPEHVKRLQEDEGFPRGFREVLREVAARKPRSLSER